MTRERRLGRGLEALLGKVATQQADEQDGGSGQYNDRAMDVARDGLRSERSAVLAGADTGFCGTDRKSGWSTRVQGEARTGARGRAG